MTFLCLDCFDDAGLKLRIKEIRKDFSSKNKCNFHPSKKGIPVSAIAEIIDPVFQQYYQRDPNFSYDTDVPIDDLCFRIGELTQCEPEIAKDIESYLIESDNYRVNSGGEEFYSDTVNYICAESNQNIHSLLWESFCEKIKHEQRFFNSEAKDLLIEIFDGIQYQTDESKRHPVYKISPNDEKAEFFRARITNSEDSRNEIRSNPEQRLGPPPKRKRKAGRMNPSGITTFYGGFDLSTCVAELRPVVGSIIVGAQFKLERPIYVLDTTRFHVPIKDSSPFYKKYFEKLQQWQFMQQFMYEISKPVLPTDEHIDYIPTQAVAEFLLNNENLKLKDANIKIEGIIYPSAQYPNGKNIAFLGDAALVKTELPDKSQKNKDKIDNVSNWHEYFTMYEADKDAALALIPNSITSIVVSGANYSTDDFYDKDEQSI